MNRLRSRNISNCNFWRLRAGVWGRPSWLSLSRFQLVIKNIIFSWRTFLFPPSKNHNLDSWADAETKWIAFYVERFEVAIVNRLRSRNISNCNFWRLRAGVWGRPSWLSLSRFQLVIKNIIFSWRTFLFPPSKNHNLDSWADAETKWIAFYVERFEVAIVNRIRSRNISNCNFWRLRVDFCAKKIGFDIFWICYSLSRIFSKN